MCCKNSPTRILTFALALTLGLLTANVFRSEIPDGKNPEIVKLMKAPQADPSYTTNASNGVGEINEPSANTQIKILSSSPAGYTDEARKNNAQGSVTLKVVFTAEGTIGKIMPVNVLPYGLTEEAIQAARQIKFEPARRNGAPVTMVKTVEYRFTIY